MKSKFAIPVVLLLALALFLSGCGGVTDISFCGDFTCNKTNGEDNKNSPRYCPGDCPETQPYTCTKTTGQICSTECSQTQLNGTGTCPASQVCCKQVPGDDGETGELDLPDFSATLPQAYALFEFEGDFRDSKGNLQAQPMGDARIAKDYDIASQTADFEQKYVASYMSIQAPQTEKDMAYTITMRVKPANTENQSVFAKTDSGQGASPNSGPGSLGALSHQLRIENSVFVHYTYDGTGKKVTGTTKVEEGTWYFVAITAKNNGQMKLYVNGFEEGTAQSIGTLWQAGTRYEIAAQSAYSMAGFNGKIDDLAIYREEFTEEQAFGAYYKKLTEPSQSAAFKNTPVCGDKFCGQGETESCAADCTTPAADDTAPGGETGTFPGIGAALPLLPTIAVIQEAIPDPYRPESNQQFYIKGKVACEGDCAGKKAKVYSDPSYKQAYGIGLSPSENAKTHAQITLSGSGEFTLGPYQTGGPSIVCGSVVVEPENGEAYSIPVEIGVKATQQYCNTYGSTMPGGCDNYVSEFEGICFVEHYPEKIIELGPYTYNDLELIAQQIADGRYDGTARTEGKNETEKPEIALFIELPKLPPINAIPPAVQAIEAEAATVAKSLKEYQNLLLRYNGELGDLIDGPASNIKFVMDITPERFKATKSGAHNLSDYIHSNTLEIKAYELENAEEWVRKELGEVKENLSKARAANDMDYVRRLERYQADLKVSEDIINRAKGASSFSRWRQSNDRINTLIKQAEEKVAGLESRAAKLAEDSKALYAKAAQPAVKKGLWSSLKGKLGIATKAGGSKIPAIGVAFILSDATIRAELAKGEPRVAADIALSLSMLKTVFDGGYFVGTTINDQTTKAVEAIEKFMNESGPARIHRNELIDGFGYGQTYFTDAFGRPYYYDEQKIGNSITQVNQKWKEHLEKTYPKR